MSDNFTEREFRLEKFLVDFCSNQISWQSPNSGEREPEYTKRVLFPQFQVLVESLHDKNVRLLSDGTLTRPTRVIFGNEQNFYPDIALELHGKRSIAIEVKFISELSWSDSFSKAIGQGVIYSTFGYSYSHILLVSETGVSNISDGDLFDLNERLSLLGVTAHLIFAKK